MHSSAHLRVPEAKLALAGAAGAALAVLPVGLGVVLAGTTVQAATATLGTALVAVLALSALPLYAMGARGGNEVAVTMALVALGQRIMLALAVTAAVWRFTDLPLESFAIGLAVGLVASITGEMVAASRDPRFFWVMVPKTAAVTESPIASHSGTERQL